MAIVKSYSSSASQSEGRPVHYVVDLTAELPTNPNIGDTAFCKQTNYFMKSTNGTSWTNQAGGEGAAAFTDLTGTASVAQGGTGASNEEDARTALGLGTAATSDTGDFAAAAHAHAQTDITSLVSDLAGKAASSHTHALATDVTGTLSMARGGTGQSNATDARTALGLGSLATQSSVAASSLTGSLALGAQSGDLQLTDVTGTLSFANGGTGQSNATDVRTALGLGSLATQNSIAASALTGSLALGAQSGDLQLTDVTGTLALVNGGTGQSNAASARTALGLGSLATASSIILTTDTTGTLAMAEGGTNASNAADARTNLGLGSLATQSSVAASSLTGSLSLGAQSGDLQLTDVSGTLAIVNGGTGQANANSALNALLPSQVGNSGKYLTTDATNASWGTVVGGSPFTTVRKTGLDQGAQGVVLQGPVNQMDFTLASSTNYVFEYWIRYQTAAATTGLVLGLQTAQTPVGIWMNWQTPLAATGTVTGGSAIGSNTTLSIASGNIANGGVQLAYLTGMVMGGVTGGTMSLKWCSEVTGSLCTIKTGTMGRIMAIT